MRISCNFPNQVGLETSGSAELDLELEKAADETHANAMKVRPAKTNEAYIKRQDEFKSWCAAKGFDPMTQ